MHNRYFHDFQVSLVVGLIIIGLVLFNLRLLFAYNLYKLPDRLDLRSNGRHCSKVSHISNLNLKVCVKMVKRISNVPFHLPINELQQRCFPSFVYKQMSSMTNICILTYMARKKSLPMATCARYENERLHLSPGLGGSKAG